MVVIGLGKNILFKSAHCVIDIRKAYLNFWTNLQKASGLVCNIIFVIWTCFQLSNFFEEKNSAGCLLKTNGWWKFAFQCTQTPCQMILQRSEVLCSFASEVNNTYFMLCKDHMFEGGHNIFRNLHFRFDWHSIGQIYVGYFAKLCGLLRIFELYLGPVMVD